MSDGRAFSEWMATTGPRDRAAEADAVYKMAKSAGKLSSHRILTYRCQDRRCLLLDVLQLPAGLLVHQPRYKVAPKLNEASSNPEGRARNTEDGDRRWKGQTFLSADARGYSLHCDHITDHHLAQEVFDADLAAGRTEIVVTASL